ncbi:mitochondrial carrier [Limtongia smithiae]|uniref:mitochondrial carrier n=1 Tax=Limtongia smithiae TaxID=1125753 RepID=UPI0034CF16F5
MDSHPVLVPLLSGGAAGTCTDLFFFPIDTLKTRLQAKGGFFRNGGWHGVYRGVGSAIVGSSPAASLFFLTYEGVNAALYPHAQEWFGGMEHNGAAHALTHMTAAILGEIAACTVRVPTEVVKQRAQASASTPSSLAALKMVLANTTGEGRLRGLYRGYMTTIMREIPFTAIQFPLYEALKRQRRGEDGTGGSLLDGAMCGAVAGGIAAAATTPLDVLKTRVMLHATRVTSLRALVAEIAAEEGARGFFRGIAPRTMWISMGGAVFLGVYETAKVLVSSVLT